MKVTECKKCGLEIFSNEEDAMCGNCEDNEKLKATLKEITSMPFRSDKPYTLMDAVELAFKTLKEIEER